MMHSSFVTHEDHLHLQYLASQRCVCFFKDFYPSLMPYGKFGSSYLGKATSATRAAQTISDSVCNIFVSSGMAASICDFNRC